MARTLRRGDLWFYRFAPPDRRRPVLVLTRNDVVNRMRTVVVAPVTTTIRGIRSEVRVGRFEGLNQDSVVNLDHVQTVPRADLHQWIGRLGSSRMFEVCRALNTALGCETTMVREEPWVF